MSRSTGLGAALDPACLADPISFYAVTDGHYYRSPATGRVFRLIIDREAIAAANDSDDASADGIDFREMPPDVIAHALSRPIATWQLAAEFGDEIAALVHDVADEIDAHEQACPLAAVAPMAAPPAVLGLTRDVTLVVMVAIERGTAKTLTAALAARGVIAETILVFAQLQKLQREGLVEAVSGVDSSAIWAATVDGLRKAAKLQAALAAVSE